MIEKIKPLNRSVLIEQKMKKKPNSGILTPGEPSPDSFEVEITIIDMGKAVPEDYGIKVGDTPILNKHSISLNDTMISEELDLNKERKAATFNLIVDYEDIVGVVNKNKE